jgi:hypothetical protein
MATHPATSSHQEALQEMDLSQPAAHLGFAKGICLARDACCELGWHWQRGSPKPRAAALRHP